MCIRDRINEGVRLAYNHPDNKLRASVVDDPLFERRNTRDCLLYTSDAADERSSVDLGGRRIIKKKKRSENDAGDTHDKANAGHMAR